MSHKEESIYLRCMIRDLTQEIMLLRDRIEDHETDLEMAFDLIMNLEANEGCDCECKFQKTIKHLVKRVVEMEETLNAMDRDRRFKTNPFAAEFNETSGNCNCQ